MSKERLGAHNLILRNGLKDSERIANEYKIMFDDETGEVSSEAYVDKLMDSEMNYLFLLGINLDDFSKAKKDEIVLAYRHEVNPEAIKLLAKTDESQSAMLFERQTDTIWGTMVSVTPSALQVMRHHLEDGTRTKDIELIQDLGITSSKYGPTAGSVNNVLNELNTMVDWEADYLDFYKKQLKHLGSTRLCLVAESIKRGFLEKTTHEIANPNISDTMAIYNYCIAVCEDEGVSIKQKAEDIKDDAFMTYALFNTLIDTYKSELPKYMQEIPDLYKRIFVSEELSFDKPEVVLKILDGLGTSKFEKDMFIRHSWRYQKANDVANIEEDTLDEIEFK